MIKIAFIGVGGYGRPQLESFLPLQQRGEISITALVDPSVAALDVASALPGLERAARYTDYRQLLAEDDVDAAVVVAPIPLHYEITTRLLDRGLYILLEKPPVPLLSQLEDLIVRDTAGRVMVGFQYCYSHAVADLQRRIRDGEFGKLLSLSASGVWPRSSEYYNRADWAGKLTWRGNPTLDGPATNAMSHFLNLLFYLGATPPDLSLVPVEVAGEVYRSRPIESYDFCALRGKFSTGVQFSAGFSHLGRQALPVKVVVRGDKKTAEVGEKELQGTGTTEGTRDALVRAFVAFASGQTTANRTPLTATRPYVLATNLMFQSSGGIHNLDTRNGDEATLNDLNTRLIQATNSISSLHEAGAPSACNANELSADAHCETTLLRLLAESHKTAIGCGTSAPTVL